MVNKLRHAHEQARNLFETLGLIRRAAPTWTTSWMVLLFIQGLLPVSTVLLSRPLVNVLVTAKSTNASWESLRPALVLIALIAGLLVVGEVLRSITDWVRTAQSELVQDHISALIHAKAVAIDIAFYDSADYYDRLHRACTEASTRPVALLESLGSLIKNGVTFAVMAAILVPYGAWLPPVLIAATMPAAIIVFRFNRRYHQWWERTTADRRRAQYYDLMLTNSGAAAEVRLFDLGNYLRSAFQELRARLRGEHLDLMRNQSFARIGAGAIGLIVSGLTMGWMALKVLRGATTLGDLALFYQAFGQGQGLLRSLLGNTSQIYSNTLFLSNLFEFLALTPQVVDPVQRARMPGNSLVGVRLRNVTFRYPGSERPALRGLNMTIPAGQTVAIVGVNGAGKTTLIKLLCRFYDPQSGSIELDGIDLRDMSIHELRKRITVLFQLPWSHHATAAENIALGDLQRAPTRAQVEEAARRAGAHEFIAQLPNGYDTMLGRWFADGSELSVGQWQRIALARTIVRDAPIVILDEPTSFMDSWAEIEWLHRFRELVRDRTTIFITHRFTSAMYADVIYVMEDGQIVESGTHDQLVAQGGRYAKSWSAQIAPAERSVVSSVV